MVLGFLGVVSLISGTLVFLVGLHNTRLSRRLRRHGIHTSGLVVDQTRVDSPKGQFWKPVISFTDQHGRTVTFQPGPSGDGFGLPTGQEVPVVYLADNPEKVRVDTWRFMLLQPLFLLFFGSCLLGFAVAAILWTVIGA